MRPSLALSPPSIYFSPFRSVESPRCDQPIWVTLLSSFSDRPFFKIITPSLFLPLYLSVARFRGSDRSRYSYDLWTNDPRGISPKDWPNRDSTPSCPSKWHCVSSCNADYSLSWTGHGRTRSKGWKCILDGVSDYDDTHGFDGKRSENSHSSNRSSIDCVCKAT